MEIAINPCQLDEATSQLLKDLITNAPSRNIWERGRYDVADHTLRLTHTLIKLNEKGSPKYLVCDNVPFQKEKYFVIYHILTSIQFAKNELIVSPCSLSVKIREHGGQENRRQVKGLFIESFEHPTTEEVAREYQLSKRVPHLSPFPLIYYRNEQTDSLKSFLLIRYNKGTLFEHIYSLKMSLEQKLAVTEQLLHAYQKQVKAYGLAHLNILPKNVLLDLSESQPLIFFMNYESAAVLEIPGEESSAKACQDIFQLGKLIQAVWGLSLRQFSFDIAICDRFYLEVCETIYEQLKNSYDAVTPEFARGLFHLIKHMSHTNGDLRHDIDAAIEEFNLLLANFTLQRAAPVAHENKSALFFSVPYLPRFFSRANPVVSKQVPPKPEQSGCTRLIKWVFWQLGQSAHNTFEAIKTMKIY